jgi:lincosamide nucleotidyltransferase A/C/D/E
MTAAQDVLDVLESLTAANVRWCLAGGWAVDALVGEQTRPHRDVDVMVPADALPTVEASLGEHGFARADASELPAFLILRDPRGRQVDLYLLRFDAEGDGWQEYSRRRWDHFSAADLCGVGLIEGVEVRCLSPAAVFAQFLGYTWGDKAIHDLTTLHRARGTPLPPGFEESGPRERGTRRRRTT